MEITDGRALSLDLQAMDRSSSSSSSDGSSSKDFFFNQSHWTLGTSHCQDSSDEEECVHDAVPTRAPVAVEAWYQ